VRLTMRKLLIYAALLLCAVVASTAAALVALWVFGFDDFHARAVAWGVLVAASVAIAVHMEAT